VNLADSIDDRSISEQMRDLGVDLNVANSRHIRKLRGRERGR